MIVRRFSRVTGGGMGEKSRRASGNKTNQRKKTKTMKTITDKIEPLMYGNQTHGFVTADGETLIDAVNPATGRSVCYDNTLEQIQERYPGATIQSVDDFCAAKAAKQDAPGEWREVTEEKFMEMLEVLPPAAGQAGYGAFLVGEAWDHHAGTGKPRFAAFKRSGDKFYEYSRPMSFREFKAEFGETARFCYVS